MSSPKLFGLPPIPPELRSISPFIQRADELKDRDPIIAYWCLYHAAQVGLSLKPPSSAVLYKVLEVLEKMKEDIGPNDAVDVDAASIAYLENFALGVFNAADDEDRKGNSTRSTAKKFLAAANFLEVLQIFPRSEVSESNDEKVRYAKWKATEIAKSFREGQKPPETSSSKPTAHEHASPSIENSAAPSQLHMSFENVTPSHPRTSPEDIVHANEPQTPPRHPFPSEQIITTSGTTAAPELPEQWVGDTGGRETHMWTGERSTDLLDGLSIMPQTMGEPPSSSPTASNIPLPHSRSNSAEGGATYEVEQQQQPPPPAPRFLPTHFAPWDGVGSAISPFTLSPSVTPQFGHTPPFHPPALPPPPTSHLVPSAPDEDAFLDIPSHQHQHSPFALPPPPVIHRPSLQAPPLELTPMLVSKTQKHCRFAISALDYEDAETAKKELRAALALLGG